MKKAAYFILLFVLVAGAFVAGTWFNQRTIANPSHTSGRKILYYVDPMHPAYKSDKPGVAPDCGMTLEPVYADEAASTGAGEHAGHTILYYQDPQDPNYHALKPGLNPETGNTLE